MMFSIGLIIIDLEISSGLLLRKCFEPLSQCQTSMMLFEKPKFFQYNYSYQKYIKEQSNMLKICIFFCILPLVLSSSSTPMTGCMATQFSNGGVCTSCSTNFNLCLQCTAVTCTNCLYANCYKNTTSNNCTYCYMTFGNCTYCSEVICTGCVSGSHFYHSIDRNCYLCTDFLPNCYTCNSTTCLTCYPNNYYMSGVNCTLCNSLVTSCLTCNTTACLTCLNSSFILESNTLCTACWVYHPNCRTCSNSTSCSTCINANSSYLNAASFLCQPCSNFLPNCFRCSNATVCYQCINNTYAVSSVNTCNYCNLTLFECLYCSSRSTCTQCSSNLFAIDSLSKCTTCNTVLFQCLTCFSSTYCTQCIDNTVFLNTTSHQCNYCNATLNNCLTCQNSSYCLTCISNAFFIDPLTPSCLACSTKFPHCYECSFILNMCNSCLPDFYMDIHKKCVCKFGWPIMNELCTNISGCTQGQHLNNSQRVSCLACQPLEYYENPVNGSCICRQGFVVSNMCSTSIVGCESLIKMNGIKTCIMCKIQQNFILINGKCVCQRGFYLINYTCQEICGDGFRFVLPCDDGNNQNGDGCSSRCQLEDSYRCNGGTNISASYCKYIGKPVTISLYRIHREKTYNSAIFQFQLIPELSLMKRMNFSNYVTYICDNASYQISNISYGSGILSVMVNFNSNLESFTSQLYLSFNYSLIVVPNITCRFISISNDEALVVINDFPQIFLLAKIFLIIASVALFAFVSGSIVHKMIGVETLNTIQMVFFIQMCLNKPTIALNALTVLKISNSYSDWYFNDATSLQMGYLYQRMKINKSQLENFIFIFAFELVIIIILAAFLFTRVRLKYKIESNTKQLHENQDAEKIFNLRIQAQQNSLLLNDKVKKVEEWLKIFYTYLYFPLLFGFFLQIMLTLYVNNYRFDGIQNDITFNLIFNSFSCLVILIGLVIAIFIELLALILGSKETHSSKLKLFGLASASKNYIGIYCIYQVVFCLAVMLNISFDLLFQNYYMPLLTTFYLFFIIIYRPYSEFALHNFAIILNQFIITFNSIAVALKNIYFNQITQVHQSLFLYVNVALLGTVLIISFVRIIWEIKMRFKKKQTPQKQKQDFLKSIKVGENKKRMKSKLNFEYYQLNQHPLKLPLGPINEEKQQTVIDYDIQNLIKRQKVETKSKINQKSIAEKTKKILRKQIGVSQQQMKKIKNKLKKQLQKFKLQENDRQINFQ